MNIIEKIFMDCHGSTSMAGMVSLEDLYFDPSIVERLGLPESSDSIVEYLEVDLSDLYYNNGSFNPFIYSKGFVWIEIPSFSTEALKTFMIKERIKQNSSRFEEFERDGRWDLIFSMMEKKLLFPKFLEFYKEIPKDQVVDIFAELWVRSEFGFEAITEDILAYVYSNKHLSAKYREREVKLLDTTDGNVYVTVYHGTTSDGVNDDFSWSLSEGTASWFANRFGNNGKVIKGRVAVADIIDFFDWRGESEVLIPPQDVTIL